MTEIYAVGNIVAGIFPVPSRGDISPFKEFLSPAVENVSVKFDDTAIAVLYLEYVVGVVTIGCECVGHIQCGLISRNGERRILVIYQRVIVEGEDGGE